MNKSFLLSGLLVSFAAACGGGDSTPDARPISTVDARPDGGGTVDAPPTSRCKTLTDNYEDIGDFSEVGEATYDGGLINLFVGFGAEAPFDIFYLQLYPGFGPFMNGPVAAGTFNVEGDDLQYATCGVCPRFIGGFVSAADNTEFDYYSTGGEVTVTTVPTAVGETLSVSFSNLTYEHVTYGPAPDFVSTPVGDGCEVTIEAGTYTGITIDPPAPTAARTADRPWANMVPAALKR